MTWNKNICYINFGKWLWWIINGKLETKIKKVLKIDQYLKSKQEFDFVSFEDSIIKHIIPKFYQCSPEFAIKYYKSVSNVKGIYNQYRKLWKQCKDATICNIPLRVATNHLPRDNPDDVLKKMTSLKKYQAIQYSDNSLKYLIS